MASCHTHAARKYLRGYGIRAIPSFFIPYRWVHGYGRMPYPPIYPLPMGAWVWQDVIPSLFIPYRWVRGYGKMPYPPIYPLPMGAWVWQGCHTLLFTIYNQNHDKTYTSKPRQTQSKTIFSVCTNTRCLIYINKSANFDTFIHNKFAD